MKSVQYFASTPLIIALIIGPSLLVTSSALPWSCYDNYCYWSDGSLSSYEKLEDAQSVCTAVDPDSWLLEIYDSSVNNEVQDFMENSPGIKDNDVLLNLKRVDTQWKWVDGTDYNGQSKYDPSKNNDKIMLHVYRPFSTLRNLPFRGIYGPTFSTTQLNDFICSFNGPCKVKGSTSKYFNNKCYQLVSSADTLNWFQAYNLCYNMGGRLASLGDFSAKDLQSTFGSMKRMNNYWVGLFNSQWSWQHNSASITNYTNWYNGYPFPPYQNQSPEFIQTIFDYRDGGVWMDRMEPPNVSIVCMKGKSTASTTTTLPTATTTAPLTTTTTTTYLTSTGPKKEKKLRKRNHIFRFRN